MQLVAINVSMVFRTVMPSDCKVLKFLTAWIAISRPTSSMIGNLIEAIKPLIPLKRAADPDEIAGLVAYLARKESGYMTGSSLTIDGGMAL
jgi:NAD(P)-dependent dehydrogenase (short-subunit alcohol dehydrogenase family)